MFLGLEDLGGKGGFDLLLELGDLLFGGLVLQVEGFLQLFQLVAVVL